MGDVSEEVLGSVRRIVVRDGPGVLSVQDLCHCDLPLLGWSGSPRHLRNVCAVLDRVPRGEVDYLVVRAPTGEPVAKGGADYADPHGPGKLWQLATHDALRSLGIGTLLVGALEERIRARGTEWAWLGVEVDNPRAQSLYQRLGYRPFAEEADGWEAEDATGRLYWYQTQLVLMRRRL